MPSIREQIESSVAETYRQAEQKEATEQLEKVRSEAHRVVQRELTADREEIAALKSNVQREAIKLAILKTEIASHGFLADIQSNWQVLGELVNPDETPSAVWFANLFSDFPKLATRLVWVRAEDRDPETAKKKAAAREAELRLEFDVLVRRSQPQLSPCEANFQMWVANQSVQGLALASESEIEQFEIEAEEARQLRLSRATKSELRAMAKKETEVAHGSAVRTQANYELEAMRVRDAGLNYPTMPRNLTAFQLDDPSVLKSAIRKYGSYQVTQRLRGESK